VKILIQKLREKCTFTAKFSRKIAKFQEKLLFVKTSIFLETWKSLGQKSTIFKQKNFWPKFRIFGP
jgi:hypothetical protein